MASNDEITTANIYCYSPAMSAHMQSLGGRGKLDAPPAGSNVCNKADLENDVAFHGGDADTEREYDRLRDMARKEAEKRNESFQRVRFPLPLPPPPLLFAEKEKKKKKGPKETLERDCERDLTKFGR